MATANSIGYAAEATAVDRHPKGLYVLFATEMFGAVNAIDPKTGRNFEDLVPIFQSIDWLTDEERYKITEGNARKVFSRMFAGAKG